MQSTPSPRVLAGLALALSACATTEDPPPLLVENSAFEGTVLSGPLLESDGGELAFDDSWLARIELGWYAQLPGAERPIDGRLVVREGDEDLFVTRSELASGIGEGLPKGWRPATAPLWTDAWELALPAGSTLVLSAETNVEADAAPGHRWERVSVETSRSRTGGEDVGAALVLEGWIVPRIDDDQSLSETASTVDAEPIFVRERVLLDEPPILEGRRLEVLFRAASLEFPAGGYLLQLELVRRPEESMAAPIARSREAIEASTKRAQERSARFQEQMIVRSESMVAALQRGELQRPAVVFIAQSSGSRVAEELALSAEAESLGEFVRYAAERRGETPPKNTTELGWLVERRALLWLLERREDEERAMEPELYALLTRAGGELSTYPDLFRELVQSSRNMTDLWSHIEQENRVFLEDARPGPRVRAFDWLDAQGLAPAGFDPLAERPQRREALARYEESLDEGTEEQQ